MQLDFQVGQRIRQYRQERGWSQSKLSEAVFVDQKVISRMEVGTRPIRVVELIAIAEALDLPLERLLPCVVNAPGPLRNY